MGARACTASCATPTKSWPDLTVTRMRDRLDLLDWRGRKKIVDNLMDQDIEARLENLRRAPRCGAPTRAGTECQRPALRGRKRCRLHGGLSPGAPRGDKNGNFRNGNWTAEVIEERRWLRSLVQSFANYGTTE